MLGVLSARGLVRAGEPRLVRVSKTPPPLLSMASGSGSSAPSSSAIRALSLELKALQEDPLEGIRTKLASEENLFEWEVALFGPPDTLYQGGYFKVRGEDGRRRSWGAGGSIKTGPLYSSCSEAGPSQSQQQWFPQQLEYFAYLALVQLQALDSSGKLRLLL